MRRTMLSLVSIAVASLLVGRAQAAVDVVATTASMGMLARSVGGDAVAVAVLVPPDRDAHFVQAKPSMMLALRRAKLLLSVGAELEIGWLPAVLEGAGNPRILPGQGGYFEAAAQVELIEKSALADRGKGDVHPAGNPHLYLDPVRMSKVAEALASRLASIDPANGPAFAERAAAFGRAVTARVPVWRGKAAGSPGVVFFHKDGNYLARFLDVPILGCVEPLPGIPPTASHLKTLVEQLQGKSGVIVYTSFQPSAGPDFLVRQLGWRKAQLPLEPPLDAKTEDYLALLDRWVDAVASAKP